MSNFHEIGLKTPPPEPWDQEGYNFQRSDFTYMSDDSESSGESNLIKMCFDPTILESYNDREKNQSMNINTSPSENLDEPLTFNEDNTRNGMLMNMNPSMFPQTSRFFNEMSRQDNQPAVGMSSLYFDLTFPFAFQNAEREPQLHRPEDDYFVYSKFPTNHNYQLVMYFIERRNAEENGDIGDTYAKNQILTQVYHPSGTPCNVNFEVDSTVRGRYICSFQAIEPGVYIAFAHLHNERDINGSPLKIYVSRNYCYSLATTVLEFKTKGERIFNGDTGMSWGIDVDRFLEKIYLADKESNKIKMFTCDGIPLTEIGEQHFNKPTGVVLDDMNNRLIVSDKDNHRICFLSLDGQLIKTFGNRGFKDGEFNYPWGVAISPNGELIAVADSKNHRVQLFDKNGDFLRKYSLVESNPYEYKKLFDYPRGICFDNTGKHMYVSDFTLNTIFKLNIELTEKNILVPPGILRRPQGLVVDIAGNILICDSHSNCIRVVSPNGVVLCKRNAPRFHCPQNLSIYRGGLLTVLDCNGVVCMY